jgi:hypothetical protein
VTVLVLKRDLATWGPVVATVICGECGGRELAHLRSLSEFDALRAHEAGKGDGRTALLVPQPRRWTRWEKSAGRPASVSVREGYEAFLLEEMPQAVPLRCRRHPGKQLARDEALCHGGTPTRPKKVFV